MHLFCADVIAPDVRHFELFKASKIFELDHHHVGAHSLLKDVSIIEVIDKADTLFSTGELRLAGCNCGFHAGCAVTTRGYLQAIATSTIKISDRYLGSVFSGIKDVEFIIGFHGRGRRLPCIGNFPCKLQGSTLIGLI